MPFENLTDDQVEFLVSVINQLSTGKFANKFYATGSVEGWELLLVGNKPNANLTIKIPNKPTLLVLEEEGYFSINWKSNHEGLGMVKQKAFIENDLDEKPRSNNGETNTFPLFPAGVKSCLWRILPWTILLIGFLYVYFGLGWRLSSFSIGPLEFSSPNAANPLLATASLQPTKIPSSDNEGEIFPVTITPKLPPSATLTITPAATETVDPLNQMPDVIGEKLENIVELFESTPLQIEYKLKLDNTITPGTVIDQVPPAGEDLSQIQTIEITLSYNLESIFSGSNFCPENQQVLRVFRVELLAGETYQVSVVEGEDIANYDVLVRLDPPGFSTGEVLSPVSEAGPSFRTYYIDESGIYTVTLWAWKVWNLDNTVDCHINISRIIYPNNMHLIGD